jgi:hypothetical protein
MKATACIDFCVNGDKRSPVMLRSCPYRTSVSSKRTYLPTAPAFLIGLPW